MTASEYKYECYLEQKAQEEELRGIQELDRTPNWAWPDEEPGTSGFYTNYKGKTLGQLRDDIGFGDLSL